MNLFNLFTAGFCAAMSLALMAWGSFGSAAITVALCLLNLWIGRRP